MTTTPHPTPEERVEAALNDWRKDAGDLRVHFARAIREAEAAGEARGRAMERLPNDDLMQRCQELLNWYSSGELTGSAIRELADAIAPTLSTHSALRLAENRTHEDAMRFVVSFIRARTDKESSDD